jgi:hypothetical protein
MWKKLHISSKGNVMKNTLKILLILSVALSTTVFASIDIQKPTSSQTPLESNSTKRPPIVLLSSNSTKRPPSTLMASNSTKRPPIA